MRGKYGVKVLCGRGVVIPSRLRGPVVALWELAEKGDNKMLLFGCLVEKDGSQHLVDGRVAIGEDDGLFLGK